MHITDLSVQLQRAHDEDKKWLKEELTYLRQLLCAIIIQQEEVIVYDRNMLDIRRIDDYVFDEFKDERHRCLVLTAKLKDRKIDNENN